MDLSCWKFASVGAEAVFERSVRSMEDNLACLGFSKGVMRPSYGLAEATLAVAMDEPATEVRRAYTTSVTIPIGDRVPLTNREGSVQGTCYLGHGTVLPCVELRVVGPAGETLPEQFLGHLHIRGDSVTSGYWGEQPRADDEWLDTGDLGFLLDGHLYITGRSKDLVIRGGEKFFPHEIEDAICSARLCRRGGVAVVSLTNHAQGREEVVAVAESRVTEPDKSRELQRSIGECVRHRFSLSLDRVEVVRPGTLPKTTSGKLQRTRLQAMLLERMG